MQLVEDRPARPIPIRMTPLIDVVFILLVFFMLTSRLLPLDYLELDNQTRSTSAVTGEPLPEVWVNGDGTSTWDDTTLPTAKLVQRLTQAGVEEVNLATQGEASLSQFTDTLSRLSEAGVTSHWKRDRGTSSNHE